MCFFSFLAPGVDFGNDVGAHCILKVAPKPTMFEEKLKKQENEVQETYGKIEFVIGFWFQNERA